MSDEIAILEQDDNNFHEALKAAGVITPRIFAGIPVYWVNRNLTQEQVRDYRISSRTYYINEANYTEANITTPLNDFKARLLPEHKRGICLHFTAGFLEGDLQTLTGGNGFVSVPFVISRVGNIYQLLDPDKEIGWHLGSAISYWYHHNQIIGIELSNRGPDSYTAPADYKVTLEKDFRGKYNYEPYTNKQYTALNELVDAICRHYPKIERKLLPLEERYEFWGQKSISGKGGQKSVPYYNDNDPKNPYHYLEGDGINKGDYVDNWNGISSHINYVGKRQKCDSNGNPLSQNYLYHKWDIGPAFDWDRIVQQPLCNPLADNPGDKLVPFSLYANTELANKAGYFPIGANRTFHSGVHLFSEHGTQVVRAMAPGYVVAFRFYQRTLNPNTDLNALGLQHSKTTSFVLLRHEVEIAKPNNTTNAKDKRVFYSLYMDLEVNSSVMQNVPWIQKLRRLSQFNANEEIHSQGATW